MRCFIVAEIDFCILIIIAARDFKYFWMDYTPRTLDEIIEREKTYL
jgi:hypothetical protein